MSRRHCLTLLAASCVGTAASAAVTVKSPLDVPARLSTLAASKKLLGLAKAGNNFIAVGNRGHVLTSTNAEDWMQSAVPVSSDLVAVQFPTAQVGWAVGHEGVVLRTDDAGKTWNVMLDGRRYGDLMVKHYETLLAAADDTQKERLDRALADAQRMQADGADKPFLGLWFENESAGWVVGAFNLILRTEDGGKTWQPWVDRTSNEMGYTLYGIAQVGDEIFLVGELGLVRRLDRAQGQFVPVAEPYRGSLFGVTGRAGMTVVYGLRGNAFVSRDHGQTWTQLATGTATTISSGTLLPDGRLVLANVRGEIMVSDAELKVFALKSVNSGLSINDVHAFNDTHVVIAGDRGVRRVAL